MAVSVARPGGKEVICACMCSCVCVCVCLYVFTHTHECIHMKILMSGYIHAETHTHMHTHTYIHTHTHEYTHRKLPYSSAKFPHGHAHRHPHPQVHALLLPRTYHRHRRQGGGTSMHRTRQVYSHLRCPHAALRKVREEGPACLLTTMKTATNMASSSHWRPPCSRLRGSSRMRPLCATTYSRRPTVTITTHMHLHVTTGSPRKRHL